MHCRPWLFFSILSLIHFTNAALSNFTLNDADGNTLLNSLGAAISFTGSGWLAASGSSCDTCPLQPDPTRATNGTYRLGISMQNNDKQIVIEFVGVAVYIQFILFAGVEQYTHVGFTLDGEDEGDFLYNATTSGAPPSNAQFIYNATIFQRSGLSNRTHELVISSLVENNRDVGIIFDNAIISADFDPVTSGNGLSIGEIVGIVLGALGAFAILATILLFGCGRRSPRDGERSSVLSHASSWRKRLQLSPSSLVMPWTYNAVSNTADERLRQPQPMPYNVADNWSFTTPYDPPQVRRASSEYQPKLPPGAAPPKSVGPTSPSGIVTPRSPSESAIAASIHPKHRSRSASRSGSNQHIDPFILPPPAPPRPHTKQVTQEEAMLLRELEELRARQEAIQMRLQEADIPLSRMDQKKMIHSP